jgi:hypothetical protein
MATYVIGHGGWDVASNPGETVVTPGIAFSFYEDTGQVLTFGAARRIMDDIQSEIQPGFVGTEGTLVPNFTLSGLSGEEIAVLDQAPQGGGVRLYCGDALPSGLQLCTNTNGNCPTSIEEYNEGKQSHDCEGLLGVYAQNTDGDLHWIACAYVNLDEIIKNANTAVGVGELQET